MLNIIIVGIGGFVGAIARYGVSSFFAGSSIGSFPTGTFLANILGCLLIGAAVGLIEGSEIASENLRLLVITGLLGSFTTFSTFGLEVFSLLETGYWKMGVSYLGLSFLAGLLAVWSGRSIISTFAG